MILVKVVFISVLISQLTLYIMFRKELKGDKNGN